MKKLKLKETLIFYDGPQLVTAVDRWDNTFICVAAEDRPEGSLFLAAATTPDSLAGYQAGEVDLRYLLARSHKNQWYTFILPEKEARDVKAERAQEPKEEWLPDSGFFVRQTTTSAGISIPTGLAVSDIHIDGKWDMQDLSAFPNRYAEVYSFLFALGDTRKGPQAQYEDLFSRYPWRGGFSSVNFYDDLYAYVPRGERLAVESIAYSSPGTIRVRARKDFD